MKLAAYIIGFVIVGCFILYKILCYYDFPRLEGPSFQLELGSMITSITVLLASIGGIYQYHNSVEVRKSEHLYSLYQNFYSDDKYERGTELIEYQDKRLSHVVVAIKTWSNRLKDDQEAIIQYLNFFLYLGFASEKGNLNRKDVADLFGYYYSQLSINYHLDQRKILQEGDIYKDESQEQLATLLIGEPKLGFRKLARYANDIYKIKQQANEA